MDIDYFANTTLAQTSRTLFNKKLQQFVSFMPQQNRNLDYIVDNPELASKILTQQTTITQTSANRHMFYSAIVAYIKHTDLGKKRSEPLKNRWIKIQKTNWEERRQQSINNEPSYNQIEVAKTVDWQTVIKKRDSLPSGSNERLLLSLYTYLPPVRADYFDVRINPKSTEGKINSLLLDKTRPENSYIIIHDFKTATKYKEIKHELPSALFNEIHESLRQKPRSYLFTMQTDAARPYDRGSFSKWANKVLQELFNVPMTLTSLRHLYVSTLDFNKTRASDLEKIGNSMGHSLAMQKGYQWIS